MRILHPILVVLLSVANPACGAAQEANLLKFNRGLAEIEVPGGTLVLANANQDTARSMYADFEQGGFGGTGQSETIDNVKCVETRHEPTWWLPSGAELRRTYYFDMVDQIACESGLPTHLLDAVIAQESGYNPWAVSSAGAIGIMQIMPGTARHLRLANPFDPVANMRAGARYLRQQLDRFGRVDLALAAYNAGPDRRSLRAGYVPAIPETQHYVRTITTNWARLTQLGQFSAELENREQVALSAIRATGYREVEFIRYDGLNSANPM